MGQKQGLWLPPEKPQWTGWGVTGHRIHPRRPSGGGINRCKWASISKSLVQIIFSPLPIEHGKKRMQTIPLSIHILHIHMSVYIYKNYMKFHTKLYWKVYIKLYIHENYIIIYNCICLYIFIYVWFYIYVLKLHLFVSKSDLLPTGQKCEYTHTMHMRVHSHAHTHNVAWLGTVPNSNVGTDLTIQGPDRHPGKDTENSGSAFPKWRREAS